MRPVIDFAPHSSTEAAEEMRSPASSIVISSSKSIRSPELASIAALEKFNGVFTLMFPPDDTFISRSSISPPSSLMRSEPPELAFNSSSSLSEKHSLMRPSAA